MIHLQGVTYTYPGQERPVLETVDLEVAAGEFLLVAGPSGAGKSSLLRCLNGLVPHFYGGRFAGTVRVAGRDPLALGPRGMSDLVGFVPQDPERHFVTERVEDELAFAMENHGLPRGEMAARLEEVCGQLDLGALRRRRVANLSGGEAQRVAVGSVLALRPRVLVLDEPTSQLDPETAQEVLGALLRLNAELGLTLVISEHRLERIARHAHRVLELDAIGRRRLGEPRQVLAGSPLAPPMLRLGEALGWRPLPLTVEEARAHLPATPPEPTSATAHKTTAHKTAVATRSGEVLLAARGVDAGYPDSTAGSRRRVLRGLDLEIRRGVQVALLGANGSGKTTLLKTLIGLLPPTAGRVELAGQDLRELPLESVARRVGFVPQDPGRLLLEETVAAEIRFTRRAQGLPALEPAALEAELRQLGLEALEGAHPRDLSTGERQRTALAAILTAAPDVLLLDEPTRGLDAPNKERLTALLADWKQRGLTLVMATHDVELAAEIADRAVLLAGGGVAADGPLGEVMAAFPAFASEALRLLGDPACLTTAAARERLQPPVDSSGDPT